MYLFPSPSQPPLSSQTGHFENAKPPSSPSCPPLYPRYATSPSRRLTFFSVVMHHCICYSSSYLRMRSSDFFSGGAADMKSSSRKTFHCFSVRPLQGLSESLVEVNPAGGSSTTITSTHLTTTPLPHRARVSRFSVLGNGRMAILVVSFCVLRLTNPHDFGTVKVRENFMLCPHQSLE